MAIPQDGSVGAWLATLDQQSVDPLTFSDMDVDITTSQKPIPAQLKFGEPDAFFSDPWGKERPLSPLDQNVPRWFQRRKLALVPEDLPQPADRIPTITLDAEMDLEQQENILPNMSMNNSLKRARSNIDMADRFSRDSMFFDQFDACGQVVNEIMKSSAVQSLISKKRKVDHNEPGMDDMRSGWKRQMNTMNGSCMFGNTLGRDTAMSLTSADFCSWNFGFDVHMATGRC
jgi:hypothetical protein